MSFRLLLSCFVGLSFGAWAMEQSPDDKIALLCQQIQKLQAPAIQERIRGCLSRDPFPTQMNQADFLRIREICIDSSYAPLLAQLVIRIQDKYIVDPNSYCYSDFRTHTLLGEAIYHHAYANAQVLLQAGAHPNSRFVPYGVDLTHSKVPLNYAISAEDVDMLRLLVDHGAELHKDTSETVYYRPLMHAVERFVLHTETQEDTSKSLAIIKILLEKGVDPDQEGHPVFMSRDDKIVRADEQRLYYTPRQLAQANHLSEVLELFTSKP